MGGDRLIVFERPRIGRLLSYGIDGEIADSLSDVMEISGQRYMVETRGGRSGVVAHSDLEDYGGDEVDEDIMAGGAPPAPVPVRGDFSETAFFRPHLLIDEQGVASIGFRVPDSLTDWKVCVLAMTRDLRFGNAERTAVAVKDLMVRPQMPRFLREGDRAELRVVIDNAGEAQLTGTLDLDLFAPDTEAELQDAFGLDAARTTDLPFTVGPGASTTLSFPITVSAPVGPAVCRVVARAGDLSDGEQRPLPVLPGRMHLMQSRFTALGEGDRRELDFADMADPSDPSRIDDQLVVTIDAQLFYSVLNAMPHLLDDPTPSTFQLANRFLCAGIMARLYEGYPAVADMAASLSGRDSPLQPWDPEDPNRRLLLEETPWLLRTAGGPSVPLLDLLDPETAIGVRKSALARLEEAQRDGGFSWKPGGPTTVYATLHVLHDLSKALEFGVEVPKRVVRGAWTYLKREIGGNVLESAIERDCCWEQVTWLNYILSRFPHASWYDEVYSKAERERMLDFSFERWTRHSRLLKCCLALTLARSGDAKSARAILDQVLGLARRDPQLGLFWAPEDRAWLWYNDTVEAHVMVLLALQEIDPDDDRRHDLVKWLMANRHLNHWDSTRATAAVIYAMVRYLEGERALGKRETVSVSLGSRERTFVFEPDRYTGAENRLIVTAPDIDPRSMAKTVVEKTGPGRAFASATWHFSTDRLPHDGDGDLFEVERRFFRRHHDGARWVLTPLETGDAVAVGDQVEIQFSIEAGFAAEFVHLRDPRGAGFEPMRATSRYRYDRGLGYHEEIRDSGMNYFFPRLPAGQYTLSYRVRATMAGTFKVGPAVLQSMYAPEFVGYSSGREVSIE